jgi:ABC-2 type transport system ATP-binding protein
MQRRLNLSVPLLHDPPALLLDEPTVGVDPQSRNHIFASIERLKAEGRTVLYTTHYMEEAERLCDRVATLSGGMKRRLNMAVGIIHSPRVILLDEPTVGVDPQSRNRIFEMIKALGAEGIAVLYTTHYMEEAERLCDRIAVVDHGRVIAEGARDRLVRDAFGTRSEVRVRFESPDGQLAAWARERGGRLDGGVARFEVQHAAEIGGLLEGAARAGHEVVDVSLHKPNLESVFLHLTGRELRE